MIVKYVYNYMHVCIIYIYIYICFSFICVFHIKDLQIALLCMVVWDSKNYCAGYLNINNHWGIIGANVL